MQVGESIGGFKVSFCMKFVVDVYVQVVLEMGFCEFNCGMNCIQMVDVFVQLGRVMVPDEENVIDIFTVSMWVVLG